MKKRMIFLLALVCVFVLMSCGKKTEEGMHLGLDAVIVEIDAESGLLYVKDPAEANVFGERRTIDCQQAIEREMIFYVDYSQNNGGDVVLLSFQDLQVGDAVILGAYKKDLGGTEPVVAQQLQLATQRLNG